VRVARLEQLLGGVGVGDEALDVAASDSGVRREDVVWAVGDANDLRGTPQLCGSDGNAPAERCFHGVTVCVEEHSGEVSVHSASAHEVPLDRVEGVVEG
jgi:hypothetical protein